MLAVFRQTRKAPQIYDGVFLAMKSSCEERNCGFWDRDRDLCTDPVDYMNRTDGELCCRYHQDAVCAYNALVAENNALRRQLAEAQAELAAWRNRFVEVTTYMEGIVDRAVIQEICKEYPLPSQGSDGGNE